MEQVLRSFLNLIKRRKRRTDDNHATPVLMKDARRLSNSYHYTKIGKIGEYCRIK